MDFLRNNKGIFIIVTVTVIIILGLLVLRSEKGGKIISISLEHDGFSQQIAGFTYSSFKDNIQEWKIKADSATIKEGKDFAILYNISATYIMPDRTVLKIYADRGIYNRQENVFYTEKIKKDVNVYIDDSINIVTRKLLWSGDKIYGEGEVYVKGDKFILKGYGFQGLLNKGIYEIEKDIKAVLW